YYLFFCSTSSICLSIILYAFLIMISHSHNKCHCSAYIRQFVNKSLYINRSASADDSELNIKSLIENLKNVIMKELLILYITESSIFFSISSTASFSATLFSVSFSVTLSQSSILVSMSDSPASAISVLTILTSATSALITVFITSSSHFKKIL
ncbi:hypothetical protein BDFG_09255, partial [Blastomyces dermatitidis ATCC 26199]